jgi:hypothetical protein
MKINIQKACHMFHAQLNGWPEGFRKYTEYKFESPYQNCCEYIRGRYGIKGSCEACAKLDVEIKELIKPDVVLEFLFYYMKRLDGK